MPTTTRAAVLWGIGEDWKIEEIELDDPGAGDVLVKMARRHVPLRRARGRPATCPLPHFPIIGGHEGVRRRRGGRPDGVTSVAVGDHVSMSFIPSCGRCKWCVNGPAVPLRRGRQAVRHRHDERRPRGPPHATATARSAATRSSAPSPSTCCVSENSVVKVDHDLPLDVVALVSCGVATGFGSATERAGHQARRQRGGHRHRRHRHQRRPGRPRWRAPSGSSRSTPSSSSASRPWSSAPPTPTPPSRRRMAGRADLTWGDMCDRVILSHRRGARRHASNRRST